jgi:hypothetical protein
MKPRRVYFTVSFLLPEDATVAEAREYVADAVSTMKGCYRPPCALGPDDPGDAMFCLDGDSVKVTRQSRWGKK